MPKYAVFVIFANRRSLDEKEDKESPKGDPVYEKVLRDVFNWIQEEIKAERLKGASFFDDSSEETSAKIDFDTPDEVKEGKLDDLLKENDGDAPLVTPKSSVTRNSRHALTRDIMHYFIIEYPNLDEAIAWAQSCPLSFEGSSLEIRRLHDPMRSVEEMPSDIRERSGDQALATRDKELQEGKLKKDEDGTLWAKVEFALKRRKEGRRGSRSRQLRTMNRARAEIIFLG